MEKQTEGYQNLMSMLYAFIIAFAVTLMSGLWYHLFPRDINWNASQTVLVLHLGGGVISLILFVVYFFLHQRDKEQPWWWLLTPWKLKKEADEELQHYRQRQLGHVLTWILLIIYGTGIGMALPGLLFYTGNVWMQGYYTTQALGGFHFWVSVVLVPVIFIHMLWLVKKGG